jgi:hypothetical protein
VFVDYLIRPSVDALTTILHSYEHEASEWPQLYQQDSYFTTTYQLLGTGTNVTNFHIQDKFLCHIGHLCVPAKEHANMIWEAHYSQMAGHIGMEKTVVVLQKHFYWPKLRQDVSKYMRSCIACNCEASHQEARIIHPSPYSREALGIHLDGLHVYPFVHQERQ